MSEYCKICNKTVSVPHHHGKHEIVTKGNRVCLDDNCIIVENKFKGDKKMSEPKQKTLEEFNNTKQKKHWDHLMIKNHKVMDLEQLHYEIVNLSEKGTIEFETWVCFNRKCNYLEYRLKEGHREDR